MIEKIKKYMPIVLAITFCLAYLANKNLNTDLLYLSLNISYIIKDILLFVLPIIIFACLCDAVDKIGHKVLQSALLIVVVLSLSNFLSTMVAYGCINFLFAETFSKSSFNFISTASLEPTWTLNLKNPIQNQYALIAALVISTINIYKPNRHIKLGVSYIHKVSMFILNKAFILALPFFIFGFAIKMFHEDTINTFFASNGSQLYYMLVILIGYLTFIVLAVNKFSIKRSVEYISNISPALLTAFSTMSSATALPYSIKAAQKNTNNNPLVNISVPATVSVHLVGDSICIPILAIILLNMSGFPQPDIFTYCKFAISFVAAKFAVAAVPGGGILVMLPILQKYLGFTPQMSASITAIYIFLDPIITSSNVLGNNVLSSVLCFIQKKIKSVFKK